MARKAALWIVTLALFCSYSISGKAQTYQPDYADPGFWLSMIEEWREAVEQHQPGQADSAAIEIGSWPVFELEFSIALFKSLLKHPVYELTIPPAGCRALADYLGVKREEDKNYWLKRGALLHADIALLQLQTGMAFPNRGQISSIIKAIRRSQKRQEKTCRSVRLLEPAILDLRDKGNREFAWIQDGKPVYESEGRHMEFGRFLLDSVVSKPSQDEMVKEWYVAIAAYGLSRGRPGYIEQHLKDAVNLFPSDALILFYAGLLHETYATPRYQNAFRLRKVKYSYGSQKTELKLARDYFQKAVKAKPDFAEGHLRLGHVLGLLGHHQEAVSELQMAKAVVRNPELQYYAALFLGNELIVLRRIADARKQFERAATLYPAAQSPLWALSQLANSEGDIRNASIAMERAFAAEAGNGRGSDPRWKYDLVADEKAAALLSKMRKIFGELSR